MVDVEITFETDGDVEQLVELAVDARAQGAAVGDGVEVGLGLELFELALDQQFDDEDADQEHDECSEPGVAQLGQGLGELILGGRQHVGIIPTNPGNLHTLCAARSLDFTEA